MNKLISVEHTLAEHLSCAILVLGLTTLYVYIFNCLTLLIHRDTPPTGREHDPDVCISNLLHSEWQILAERTLFERRSKPQRVESPWLTQEKM